MNEYLSISVALVSASVGFSVGVAFGAIWATRDRKPKPRVVVQSSSHKTEPVKAWSPVERVCASCHDTYWADAGYIELNCHRCRYNKLLTGRTVHNTDRHS